jgi:hypothetical protein
MFATNNVLIITDAITKELPKKERIYRLLGCKTLGTL